MNPTHHPPLTALLAPLRNSLWYAAGFSVFVNLMLLGPTLYMLQVFDRVLSSRSEATLFMLSLGVAIALVAMSVVDTARSRLLVALGRRTDEALGEAILRHLVRNASTPTPQAPSSGLQDVASLRAFLSGSNVIALFDAPWMIIYLIVIFWFHPNMGAVALFGALLLIGVAMATERSNRSALEQLAGATRAGAQYIDRGLARTQPPHPGPDARQQHPGRHLAGDQQVPAPGHSGRDDGPRCLAGTGQ
jgi:ABC-type protease/lipase transport system fused ATPase/permease subunit